MAKRQHTEDLEREAETAKARVRDSLVAVTPMHTTARFDPETAEPSRDLDEHRGLAARLLDLRKTVEEGRLAQLKEYGDIKSRVALLEQHVVNIEKRVDRECEAIQKMQRELDQTLREGGDQLRQSGAFVRKIDDQMKALEELRETQSDPHEVVKPILRSLALLRGDLETLGKTIDIRFEQMPKTRSQPWEERGDDSPTEKQARLLADLHQRVKKLEA